MTLVDHIDNFLLHDSAFRDVVGPPTYNKLYSFPSHWEDYPLGSSHERSRDWMVNVKEHLCIKDGGVCKYHRFHVMNEGDVAEEPVISDSNEATLWKQIQQARPDCHLAQVLSVEELSWPLLQMLGTKYEIEPYFFYPRSKIPLSFKQLQRGRISVNLRFPCSRNCNEEHQESTILKSASPLQPIELIDLILDGQIDWVRIYVIREGSEDERATIVCITSLSSHLPHNIISEIKDDYWKTRFKSTNNPILVLFPFLWYVVRSWEQALEDIDSNLVRLEDQVLEDMNLDLTRHLHHIRARLFASAKADFGHRNPRIP